MKNIFTLLLIFISILSCTKKKEKLTHNNNIVDSISKYISLSHNDNLDDKEKLKALDKASQLILVSKNSIKTRDYTYDLITQYYTLSNWNKYKQLSKTLLKNSLISNDTLNLAKSYRSLGNFYFNNQVLDSAFYFYSKSEKKYKLINDLDGYSTILLKKGIIQYNINDYLAADLSLSTSLAITKQMNDKAKTYAILNQLGLVSNQLKEYDKALSYLKEALKIIDNNDIQNNDHQKSICLSNIGLVYESLKDYNKAIYYYKIALKVEDLKKSSPTLYSNILDNLAYSKLQKRDYIDLPNLFFEAFELRKKMQNKSSIIVSYIHLSEFYQIIGNNQLSIHYSKIALKNSKNENVPLDIISSLKQAALVDKINSSKYSEDYIRISDSLQLAERNSKDRFARIELETEEIKKENVFLEAKNRDILNYFMGTMAIAGLLFFMRAQRAKSRELILKQAQQKANEDIYKLIISQQGKIDEGRIMEKTRIAKELHDGVLGRMFGLRLNLDGLNHRTDEEAVAERIRCLEELKIIEQDLREISHELSREKYVLINNFVAIVNNLLEEQTKINTAVLSATIGEDIDWELLSNTTKINLYRILQESLQNINKYAQAKTIKVDLRKDKKGNLVLNIVDDGVGFETDKNSKGIGLKNIVTRTHESEGIIDIKSSKNKGTQIKVTVPLENKSIKI